MTDSSIEKALRKLQKKGSAVKAADDPPPVVQQSAEVKKVHVLQREAQAAANAPATKSTKRERRAESDFLIDVASEKLANFLNPLDPDQRLLEEFRRIKRPLVLNALERNEKLRIESGNLIMVTSSVPGEGKTYTAANLALSMSMEKDISIMLIDCDVHKKSLSLLFDCEDAPGLLDYLDSPLMDLSELMVDATAPNLSFVPAGQWRRDAYELLAGMRMADLAREIAERYEDRIVIFDTPPLMASNDPSVLARYMGQLVMVIEAESTTKATLADALSRVPSEKFVGLVFNKAAGQSQADAYGYYGSEPK